MLCYGECTSEVVGLSAHCIRVGISHSFLTRFTATVMSSIPAGTRVWNSKLQQRAADDMVT